MNDDRPVSLYLVVPPSDKIRLRRLIRLMFTMVVNRLTERMAFDGSEQKRNKHRLLFLIDEFPSLNRMEIFADALSYMAGYGLKPLSLPAATSARIRGMLQVRDAVREVFRTQLQDAPEQAITEARRHLNRSYDSFVSRFGPLNSVQNVRALAGDPDQPLLLSLEEFNPETKAATKTAIFDRRTLERYRPVERVETAAEALLISLNETGDISWPRMEELTGKPAPDLQDELGSLAYRNPEGGTWETADRYLSGNVRAQLLTAKTAAQLNPAYQRNIEALQAVQPPDLEPGEIEARLGSSWIPRSDIRHFVAELLDVAPATVKVGYAESIATWTLELDYAAKYTVILHRTALLARRTFHKQARETCSSFGHELEARSFTVWEVLYPNVPGKLVEVSRTTGDNETNRNRKYTFSCLFRAARTVLRGITGVLAPS